MTLRLMLAAEWLMWTRSGLRSHPAATSARDSGMVAVKRPTWKKGWGVKLLRLKFIQVQPPRRHFCQGVGHGGSEGADLVRG